MKGLLLFVALLTLSIATPGFAAENPKVLIAYFSHSGNTRNVAMQIHKEVGGDIFEIKTVKQYTRDFDSTVEEAREEQKTAAVRNWRQKLPTWTLTMLFFWAIPTG